ncbi:NAD(P)/FAD-dependent oxidoreductase [Mycoplasmatota bacterium WC44]
MSLKRVKVRIKKVLNVDVQVEKLNQSIRLSGDVDSWEKVVKAGLIAGKEKCKGVINELQVPGLKEKEIHEPNLKDLALDGKKVDVLVIGAGITGASIARELSKWDISVLVVDKEDDVAMHASSRNDGMIHPGLAAKPGTLKAKYNVLGNAMYDRIASELGVEFKRFGSLVLFTRRMKLYKPLVKRRIRQNKIPNTRFINKKELYKREPHLRDGFVGALELKTTGSLSPYKLVIAYLENAIENGVELSLNTIVKGMEHKESEIHSVMTNRGTVYPKVVVNAAGVYSDKIAEYAQDLFFTIHPRKGEALILDKKSGSLINHNLGIFKTNTKKNNSKGGGIVRTVEDNLLVGPTAKEIIDREEYSTTQNGYKELIEKQLTIVDNLTKNDIITYFSGIRAATYKEDFIVSKSRKRNNLVHAAGIQSPGLASAPAISAEVAKMTTSILKDKIDLRTNANFNPFNKPVKDVKSLPIDERNKLIKENSDYGKIICRCEEISKGEIVSAINRNIPATTLDAIKRRVRATGGRCQGGFCTPLIMEIIAKEANLNIEDITKSGDSSNMLYGKTK